MTDRQADRLTDLELIAWKNLARQHLDRFSNKATRTAFLVGLSLGARQADETEKLRVCRDLKSLYNIDLAEQVASSEPTVRKTKALPANLGLIDSDMASRLAALKQTTTG